MPDRSPTAMCCAHNTHPGLTIRQPRPTWEVPETLRGNVTARPGREGLAEWAEKQQEGRALPAHGPPRRTSSVAYSGRRGARHGLGCDGLRLHARCLGSKGPRDEDAAEGEKRNFQHSEFSLRFDREKGYAGPSSPGNRRDAQPGHALGCAKCTNGAAGRRIRRPERAPHRPPSEVTGFLPRGASTRQPIALR